MKKENVLEACYSVLRKTTPLDFDCGKICGGKCCGGDDETGMLLFPGEEKFLDKNIKIIENENGDKIAVCDGKCDRNKRPLACRIYPLFPIIYNEKGQDKIKVVFDIRANCPLSAGEYNFTRSFTKAVRRVGKYLLLNEETADFYKELSEMIEDNTEFARKFEKN